MKPIIASLCTLLSVLCLQTTLYSQESFTPETSLTMPQLGVSADPVTDVQGNTYMTIKIGEQIWMAENLRVTQYSDGTPLIEVQEKKSWKKMIPWQQSYCWLFNDSAKYASQYGALYNWSGAVKGEEGSSENPSALQGICPDGWHLPSDAEWKQLELAIGMPEVAVNNVKERGTDESSRLAGGTTWIRGVLTNDASFSESGFEALPSSCRYDFGQFYSEGYICYFWSSSDFNPSYAWYRGLGYNNGGVFRQTITKTHGLSVRCVKD